MYNYYMNTESFPPKDKLIDKLSLIKSISIILEDQKKIFNLINNEKNKLKKIITLAYEKLKKSKDGRIIYVGAGTSARISVQDGSELNPTFNWPHSRIEYVIAGGLKALVRAQEGAEDNIKEANLFIKNLKVNENDVLIATSASGQTPFTIEAIKEASKCNALTVAIVNNKNTELEKYAKISLVIETGYELVAGSTRLKAGTVQKICLNLISTLLMTKFGKVKNGLMSDLKPTNKKLLKRLKLIKKHKNFQI